MDLKNQMEHSLETLISKFEIKGKFQIYEVISTGHINDTYKIITTAEGYILQKINHHIFTNVPMLQDNIVRVTGHIRSKLMQIPGSNPRRQVVTVIPTKDGKPYFLDADGNYWRMLLFIEGCKCFETMSTPSLANDVGFAFGNFTAQLADIGGGPLFETIRDFHNMEWRLQQLKEAIQTNRGNRLDMVTRELALIEERAEDMCRLQRYIRKGIFPQRIVHCDTKTSNILFDEKDKPICIIDLDTVMTGLVTSDFGDAMRTGINRGKEDDTNLEEVSINIPIFEGFANGYIRAGATFLEKIEIENLVFSTKLFPYMQAVRFLADFIDGNRYYKIHHPMHNYERTKAQLKLMCSVEEQEQELHTIVARAAKEYLKT